MNEQEKQALKQKLENIQTNVKQINSNLPTFDLVNREWYKKQSVALKGLVESEEEVDDHLSRSYSQIQFHSLKSVQSLPFKEIFLLLKDAYNGKFNDNIQEILSSVKSELTMKPNNPDDPDSPQHLEIKIDLMADVIDKYAELLKMVLGKKTSVQEDEIINSASAAIQETSTQLKAINVLRGMRQVTATLNNEILHHKEKHCIAFFCTGKTIGKYQTLMGLFDNLIENAFSEDELAGALYMLIDQINVLPSDLRDSMHASFNNILTSNSYPLDDIPKAQLYKEKFSQRSLSLGVEWSKPYSIERAAVVNAEPLLSMSPA